MCFFSFQLEVVIVGLLIILIAISVGFSKYGSLRREWETGEWMDNGADRTQHLHFNFEVFNGSDS